MPRTENRFSNSSITGGQASQDSSQGMPLAATGIGGVGTDEATKETAAELAASADELYTVIQWKWSAPHGEFVSYEKYANLTIERAFKRGQARVKVSVLRQSRQTTEERTRNSNSVQESRQAAVSGRPARSTTECQSPVDVKTKSSNSISLPVTWTDQICAGLCQWHHVGRNEG